MTLLLRRPRECYSVYSEEEYLNGAGVEPAGSGEWPALAPPTALERARRGIGERRRRRAAGMAMLAGAVSAVSGVLAVGLTRGRVGGNRPTRAISEVRLRQGVRSPLLDGSRAPLAQPAIVSPRGQARMLVTRSRQVRRSARHSERRSARSARMRRRLRIRSHGAGSLRAAAPVLDSVRRRSPAESRAIESPPPHAPRPADQSHRPPTRPEFGFER